MSYNKIISKTYVIIDHDHEKQVENINKMFLTRQ